MPGPETVGGRAAWSYKNRIKIRDPMHPSLDEPSYTPPVPPLAGDSVSGLGVLAGLRRNAWSAFPARCQDTPVVRLRLPGRALLLASAPEAVRHVLQTGAADYERQPAQRRILRPIVGRGLLVSEGDAWRRQRRVMAPAFTPRSVSLLAGHVVRCAEAACVRLRAAAGSPINLLASMQQLSLEVAATSMFSLEVGAFGAEMRRLLEEYGATLGQPVPSDFLLPSGMPTLIGLRRARFRRRWLRLISAIVASRRARDMSDLLGGGARDLFDLLTAAHGGGDPELLADEAATVIVAGHETVALTLFWALLLLAQVPTWHAAVTAEARAVDLSTGGAAMALAALPCTRAVVEEALRLYPPAFMTARLAVRANEMCGVAVPKGAMVLVPFFLLHRNPRFWAKPALFDPGRFLRDPEPNRFTYLPFGAGPRICIGAQFALTEAVLGVACLLRDMRVCLVGGRPVLPTGQVFTLPDHVPSVTLHPI